MLNGFWPFFLTLKNTGIQFKVYLTSTFVLSLTTPPLFYLTTLLSLHYIFGNKNLLKRYLQNETKWETGKRMALSQTRFVLVCEKCVLCNYFNLTLTLSLTDKQCFGIKTVRFNVETRIQWCISYYEHVIFHTKTCLT